MSRHKERLWVLDHKETYVMNLWNAAKRNEKDAKWLTSGLRTLWSLSQGRTDEYVSATEIIRMTPILGRSPSCGLYAWLDSFDDKLGAGIVERAPGERERLYRIRREFREAVDRVMGVSHT